MDALRAGIYSKLAADGTLTGLLSTYRTKFAIVDGYDIPMDMESPCVQYTVISDNNNDTKTGRVRVIVVDFTVFTTNDGDPIVIAERIRTLFHRVAITVSGWTNIITEVTGPVQVEQDDSVKSSILSIEFTLA